jgi:hypothetical protein
VPHHHADQPDALPLHLLHGLEPAIERGLPGGHAGQRAKGYNEDKVILEAVQQRILRDPRGIDYPEIIVAADQAAIQSRRKLQAQLAAERKAA